ncbi:MAG: DNA repair protein RecO [Leptolyngbyaceae cyanobacterium CSU_1_3]|nr:DNA repair protein RecO [Leptolyngbyaceae cyanobacterium CSU_1_3]
MSRTYKATGINLKSMPLGESDRILTVLTREFGLMRMVAIGSRKQNSKLGGRSGLFVVNDLLIAKGKSLDKITQAETLESYPGLGRDLKKLTAGQYLAEIVLQQALSEQPQEELYYLFNEHLARLERSPSSQVLPHLSHAVFQLLVLAGIAPQVHQCCISQVVLEPDFTNPNWQAGFSTIAGGVVTLKALEQIRLEEGLSPSQAAARSPSLPAPPRSKTAKLNITLTATELTLLQQLAQADLTENVAPAIESAWFAIERILRQYAQYHFDYPIRSAALIDSCFAPA